jgi:hypothetical protein
VIFSAVFLLCVVERTEASGADVLLDGNSVFFDSDSLDISIPLSSGMAIGVGNVVSGNLTLTTDLALS